MNDIIFRTLIPIIILIGAGTISRKTGILKSGDERVLSAYVYFFALPALFFVNMSEINLVTESTGFILSSIFPIFFALFVIFVISKIFRLTRDSLYLVIFSTIFGSVAFFGIPFVMFAFPTRQGENLATLAAASISLIAVPISIAVLEIYKLEDSSIRKGIKQVTLSLSRNPLIFSIMFGSLLSIFSIGIPAPISTALHMLGGTTSAVAIFMLGVFLYGRKYGNILKAAELSLLRIIFLPIIALFVVELLNLEYLEKSIVVLMHSSPIAVSTIVLSERYNFHKEVIASLVLISTIGAGLYLNLWLLILGIY
jgi:predicted permease